MKSSLIRVFVVTFSFAAVALLSLSPSSRAQDAGGGGSPAGGCCNINVPPPPAPPALKCGRGTKQVGAECVADTNTPAPASAH